MVDSKRPETASADGMRGRVANGDDWLVLVECQLAGESHAVRVPADELVRVKRSA
ncbi:MULTISPECIES: hypothetical protein [unclassified Caballeronia]|uniref:hypothetical protein n=1 Tax=unclassified Caballeronia TaxID=2646786 RepID=UPI00202805C6|nr:MULTISPECIES: hypothetical protein [unclassified Caballeronia]MDR5797464.1 hypothetical protein [Caballeronia sp. LZ008]